jgi:hypothetical protein
MLGDWQSKEVYLVHDSGDWRVQIAWYWHPGEGFQAGSQDGRETERETTVNRKDLVVEWSAFVTTSSLKN